MPQHATEKNDEFKITANAPRELAGQESPNCLKQKAAHIPNRKTAHGAENFEYPTGPKAH
jgi:hypothetical protein